MEALLDDDIVQNGPCARVCAAAETKRAAACVSAVMTGGRPNYRYRLRWGRPSSPWRRPSLRRSNQSPNLNVVKVPRSCGRVRSPRGLRRRGALCTFIVSGRSGPGHKSCRFTPSEVVPSATVRSIPSTAPPRPQKTPSHPEDDGRHGSCAAGRRPCPWARKDSGGNDDWGAAGRATAGWRLRRRAGRPRLRPGAEEPPKAVVAHQSGYARLASQTEVRDDVFENARADACAQLASSALRSCFRLKARRSRKLDCY